MLFYIFNTVAPVFLLVIAGYLAVRQKIFGDSMVDGLMKFAVLFAIPCLLFKATSTMDLATAFEWEVMLAFYAGSTLSFGAAVLIAWKVYSRRPGESVAIGFAALFSNLVLMGLPISERAFGAENMSPAFAIVSIHAPFCYLLGITVMELLRADGRSLPETAKVVVVSMFRNSLMIGLGLGFIVNITQIPLPNVLISAIEMLTQAALPAALFALGGILTRYSLTASFREVSTLSFLSLVIHPLISFTLCLALGVDAQTTKIVVLLASMAPGMNAYLFANMYQRGQTIAAGTVLFATISSVFSISIWLRILGPIQ
jgi:malonate transporter